MNDTKSTYYRIEYSSISQDSLGDWQGKARILRLDSNEVVDRVAMRHGKSREDVKSQLKAEIAARFEKLPRPSDWGRDPTISSLIDRYLSIRNKTYGFFVRADEATEPEDAAGLRRAGDIYEATELARIKQEVSTLSEKQRFALVNPTAEQRSNPRDPWVLDILSAKKALGGLIFDPSSEILAAYQELCDLLNAQ